MKHPHIVILVAFACFILGIMTTVLWLRSPLFDRWAKNQYFGTINAVRSDSITILNREHRIHSILLDGNTRIMAGPRPVSRDQLRVSVPVIVIGQQNAEGKILAKIIRLFPPNAKNPQE